MSDHRCPGDSKKSTRKPHSPPSDRSPLTIREGTSSSRPSAPSGRSATLRRVLLRDDRGSRPVLAGAGGSGSGSHQGSAFEAVGDHRGPGDSRALTSRRSDSKKSTPAGGVSASLSDDERCERPAAPSSRAAEPVRVLIDGRLGPSVLIGGRDEGGDEDGTPARKRETASRPPAVSMSSATAAGPTVRGRPDYDGDPTGLPRDSEVRVRPTPSSSRAAGAAASTNGLFGTAPRDQRTGGRRKADAPPSSTGPSLVVQEARARPVPSGRTPARPAVADRTGDAPRSDSGGLGGIGGDNKGTTRRRGRSDPPAHNPVDRSRRADSALARLCLRAHS